MTIITWTSLDKSQTHSFDNQYFSFWDGVSFELSELSESKSMFYRNMRLEIHIVMFWMRNIYELLVSILWLDTCWLIRSWLDAACPWRLSEHLTVLSRLRCMWDLRCLSQALCAKIPLTVWRFIRHNCFNQIRTLAELKIKSFVTMINHYAYHMTEIAMSMSAIQHMLRRKSWCGAT